MTEFKKGDQVEYHYENGEVSPKKWFVEEVNHGVAYMTSDVSVMTFDAFTGKGISGFEGCKIIKAGA